MATLLKKVWDSVSKRSSPTPRPDSSERHSLSPHPPSPSSPFQEIPSDVFLQILKILGPKEAAKMSVVCKYFNSVASDEKLWVFFLQNENASPPHSWDSLMFAETHLRSAYPLPTLTPQPTQLSFMRIYGQRLKVPGSIIIDGGSGYCKYGWSKYAAPSEFGNIESPMYSRLRQFFSTIYNRMQVRAPSQPVVVSIPILHYDDTESAKASRRQLKEAIYTTLFDMNVPAVCAINQATLALYAARRTSGIVVNIGFQVTSVVPILHGKVMRKVGVEVVGLGALKLTGFLKELMQKNNISFESLYTVRTLKENLCYVAYDYEAELLKDTRASSDAAGEGQFTLSKERFQTGEILFQPRMAGVRAMGLHQAVALCMDHCDAAELTNDNAWFKTVILSGGSACLPGLAGRLEKELHGILSPSLSSGVKVIPPPYGQDTAWFGAKLISNLSTFPGPWCVTKKQFRQNPRIKRRW
ncbi:actin-related protein 8 isoform X2 [Humulus lupulus]|uniref:actin-related protein 8 isoform X2 n=1 Tax=Humulus lupulus TaxID=3486 RepID=UPI002B40CA09|nr:actin-related protein 8 isoform X2 [Humulus lupulus]